MTTRSGRGLLTLDLRAWINFAVAAMTSVPGGPRRRFRPLSQDDTVDQMTSLGRYGRV